MITDKKYWEICNKFSYIEMDEEQTNYVTEIEKQHFIPKAKKMLDEGFTKAELAACIHNLYAEYEIIDFPIFYEIEFSGDDWEQGYKMYMEEKFENPLRD